MSYMREKQDPEREETSNKVGSRSPGGHAIVILPREWGEGLWPDVSRPRWVNVSTSPPTRLESKMIQPRGQSSVAGQIPPNATALPSIRCHAARPARLDDSWPSGECVVC